MLNDQVDMYASLNVVIELGDNAPMAIVELVDRPSASSEDEDNN